MNYEHYNRPHGEADLATAYAVPIRSSGLIHSGNSQIVRMNQTTSKLDKLLQDLDAASPALVKINVEGAETAVVRGARLALQSKAHWAIQYHDFIAHLPGFESSATYSDVTALIKEAGLQILPSRADSRPWIPFHIYARHADEIGRP